MQITDVKATTVTVPLEAPLRHANGCHWGRFVRTIVEVETDDGLVGLGEMGGGGESAEAAIRAMKPYLVGHDPARLEAMRFLLANAEGKKVEFKDVALDNLKTKEEIISELRRIIGEGAAVIKRVAGKTDSDVVESQFFGKTTRRFLLMQAIAHNNNHYGQLVYFLRLNGITPPGSGG